MYPIPVTRLPNPKAKVIIWDPNAIPKWRQTKIVYPSTILPILRWLKQNQSELLHKYYLAAYQILLDPEFTDAVARAKIYPMWARTSTGICSSYADFRVWYLYQYGIKDEEPSFINEARIATMELEEQFSMANLHTRFPFNHSYQQDYINETSSGTPYKNTMRRQWIEILSGMRRV